MKKTNRVIDYLVVHCTATREGQEISVQQIRDWHVKGRGWSDIGYHYIIDIDGNVHEGRPVTRQGAHVKGYNKKSIGIVYVGGVDKNMTPKDTRTDAQKAELETLLCKLKEFYPNAEIKGHRDFSPDRNNNGIIEPFEWTKVCPCFDAEIEYKNL